MADMVAFPSTTLKIKGQGGQSLPSSSGVPEIRRMPKQWSTFLGTDVVKFPFPIKGFSPRQVPLYQGHGILFLTWKVLKIVNASTVGL